MSMKRWSYWVGALLALSACGSAGDRELVGPRHVPASSGAPEIERVVDLGDLPALPSRGDIPTSSSDGTFVVGELILIEGDDFGKLPTISIDGKPAKSLARTRAGGIVTRIPGEVTAGSVRVEVSHPEGRHGKSIEIRRYLAVGGPQSVHLALAHADGKTTAAGSLEVAGVSDLCFGHSGEALYLVVGQKRSLQAVSMAAKNGPRPASRYSLGKGDFVELACRPNVPTVAVVDRMRVSFFDTRVATALSPSGEVTLPSEASAAALSPDGAWLAVLGAKENMLHLLSVADHTVVGSVAILDNETVPLLRDLVFSPAGDEIWVLSGNSRDSMVAGTRPTKITKVSVHGISLARTGSATIGVADAPRFMAVSQREAVMAAAAIRSTADKATLLLTSLSASMLGAQQEGANAEDSASSRLVRFGLDGKGVVLEQSAQILSRALVSHDQKWAYASAQSPEGLFLLHATLSGAGSEFLRLGAANTKDTDLAIPLGIAP